MYKPNKMTKKEYDKALKSPQWKAKRKVILERDNYTCTKCGCKDNLHVHHTYYLSDKMPWEVPNSCLITLCRVCHKKEHEGRDIKSFVRNTSSKKQKKLSKRKRKDKYFNMSEKDIELQKKYDNLKKDKKLPESTYKQPVYTKGKKRNKKK